MSGQLTLNLSAKNKKILTGFIINNINNFIQYGKNNLIINTCKPMQNWRQLTRGNAIRSYKYKLIDNSIYTDMIKLNQFIDNLFSKLPTMNTKSLESLYLGNNILTINFQNKIKYLTFENLDINDAMVILNKLLFNIGNVNYSSPDYNNLIIADGNYEYAHNSVCPDDIVEAVRRKLLEKGIL